MIEEKIIEVPATDKVVCTTKCDICGKPINYDNLLSAECYYFNESEWKEFDFCYECMTTKVMPLISKHFKIEPRNARETTHSLWND